MRPEDVARDVRKRALAADQDGARRVGVCLDARFRAKAIRLAVFARAAAQIDEMRPQPRAARLPGDALGEQRAHLGGHIPFARIGARAELRRVDLEWLKGLATIVTLGARAPTQWHVIAIHGPRA